VCKRVKVRAGNGNTSAQDNIHMCVHAHISHTCTCRTRIAQASHTRTKEGFGSSKPLEDTQSPHLRPAWSERTIGGECGERWCQVGVLLVDQPGGLVLDAAHLATLKQLLAGLPYRSFLPISLHHLNLGRAVEQPT
jgi:hypothetical protein